MLQVGAEGAHHDNSKIGHGQHASDAGHRVVDPRGSACARLIDRAHHYGGERSDADGHAQTKNYEGGKERSSNSCRRRDGRANKRKPAAAMSGPTISGIFGPKRATSPPDQRDRKNISKIIGKAAAPVAVAEYFCTWIKFMGKRKKKIPSAA